MINVSVKGKWSKTNMFLEKCLNIAKLGTLDKYGRIGVDALRIATPKDSGETAKSWYYKVINDGNSIGIQWLNSSQNNGVSIVILLQYGHGLSGGGYIQGIDFINPTLKPIFKEIENELWKELTNG